MKAEGPIDFRLAGGFPLAGGAILFVLIAGFWSFKIATGGTELAASGDTIYYYAPQYAAVAAAWQSGQLPLWNAYQLCGHPWLATLQGGILYPLHLLYLVLPTHQGMAASSLLHLMIVAGGLAWFARRLRLAAWAALVAACVYATNGPVPLQVVAPNTLEAGAWLTPGAVAVHGIVRSGNPRWAALLAVSLAASLLAGYPQFSVYACYTWGALLVILLVDARSSPRNWLVSASWFGLSVVAATLLASPQLIPSFELTGESSRSLDAGSLEAIFPLGWPEGSIRYGLGWLLETSSNRNFRPFGITAPLLLLPALLHPNRRLVLCLLALLLVVLGIAIGPASPLFDLYMLLPGVESFRMPTRRLLFVIGFLLALLAGFGVDQLLRFASGRIGVRAAHVLGAALLVAAIAEPSLDDAPRPHLPYTDPEPEEVFLLEQEVFERVPDDERVLFWNPGVAPPLPSKLGAIFKVRVFDDYEPMALRSQGAYFGYFASGQVDTIGRVPFFGRTSLPAALAPAKQMASRKRLLDLASVRYLIGSNVQRKNEVLHAFAREAGFIREPNNPKLWEVSPVVYRNDRALPRAYVVYRTALAPPIEALMPLLANRRFNPMQKSYVQGEGVRAGASEPPRGHAATIHRDEPTRIDVSAELVAEGLVVLSDSYYPGWKATIDGEPAEIVPTNGMFRGVVVPAGLHRIVFIYAPDWLPLAAGAVIAGSLLVVGLAVVGARRPR